MVQRVWRGQVGTRVEPEAVIAHQGKRPMSKIAGNMRNPTSGPMRQPRPCQKPAGGIYNELGRRFMKPVDQATISAVMSELSRRRTPEQRKGGPGRPRLHDRCQCERYTRSYAAKRGHECDFKRRALPLPENFVMVPGAFR